MRGALQCVAVVIIFTVALLADGLMDSLGPKGFMLVAGPAILIAGLMICLPDHLPRHPPKRKKKNRPRGGTPRSGRKPSRKG